MYIKSPHTSVYLSVLIAFILFTVFCHVSRVNEPFARLENLICHILFGGLVDALNRWLLSKVAERQRDGKGSDKGNDKGKDKGNDKSNDKAQGNSKGKGEGGKKPMKKTE